MQRITDAIHSVATAISDHGNVALSKSLQWLGVSGSSVGGATWFAAHQGAVVVTPVENGLSLSDWGAIVGIIGGATLIIKTGVDMYFAHQRNKREKEAHDNINNR